MPKGNPNPSPATRFKKGNVANPGGKTKEQKRKEMEAAQIAADLRYRILSAMMEKVTDPEANPEDVAKALLDMVEPSALKLFKDSEDRAFGTPTSTIAGDPERPLGFSGVTLVPLETEGDDDA